MSRMYENTRTWNPFVGCRFNCIYCKPSFQAQAKRQRKNCQKCYDFEPHCHPERLSRIPKADIVFVCGFGDISFCPDFFFVEIIGAIKTNNLKNPEMTYFIQSKNPTYFRPFLWLIPTNVVLLTTVESPYQLYDGISTAPLPFERMVDFNVLDWPRKGITIEPIMDFQEKTFAQQIVFMNPEFVYIGYNSRPKQVQLPEPSLAKTERLIADLESAGIEARRKDMRRRI